MVLSVSVALCGHSRPKPSTHSGHQFLYGRWSTLCLAISSCVGAYGRGASFLVLASSTGASSSTSRAASGAEGPQTPLSGTAGSTASSHMETPQHAHRRRPPPELANLCGLGLTDMAGLRLAMAPASEKAQEAQEPMGA